MQSQRTTIAADHHKQLPKAPTGIAGLDEITAGGLPHGRATIVCGGPGCGKTILALEFLARGALEHDEPGVCVSFEESRHDLIQNVGVFGFDLEALEQQGRLAILATSIAPHELIEAGEFSLEGLFIQIEQAIARVGAKRVAIDTLDTLFSGLPNTDILRAELARLFRWLNDKGVTTVVTAERGEGSLTRHGVEEYVSDCVLLLDHRVTDQLSRRRLRIVKYRGSAHSKGEVPFLIGDSGFSVLPLSSVQLDHAVSDERIGTGVPDLDAMLGGQGFFRGSNIMVSGTPGTGKSTLSAAFAEATCRRGERCLYFAFEESPAQLLRNMRSVGIDLQPSIDRGRLVVQSMRPTASGLEEHLVGLIEAVGAHAPQAVVLDPITDFLSVGNQAEVHSMLVRVLGHLKQRQVTTFTTSLIRGEQHHPDMAISSLLDAWIALRINPEDPGQGRVLNIVKARGMEHARERREFVLSAQGVAVRDRAPRPQHRGAAQGPGDRAP